MSQTMHNEDYMTPKSRPNNLIADTKRSFSDPIHIFTKPSVLSPAISALKTYCLKLGIPFQLHQNPHQLSTLIKNSLQLSFAVIQTPRQSSPELFSHVFPDAFSFPINTESLKVVSYPDVLMGSNYQTAKDKHGVIQLYEKYMKNCQSSKIKLRKVHSSKEIKYQLVSPQTAKNGKKDKKVLFEKLVYNDFNVRQDSEYATLIESIKNTKNVQYSRKHQDVKDAIESISNKNNKLLLLLDEDNWMGYKGFIESNKLKRQFKNPRKQLVDQNVYFASTRAIQIIDELSKLGFSKMSQSHSLYKSLSTAKKNRFRLSQQLQTPPPTTQQPSAKQPIINLGYNPPATDLPSKPQLHRLSQRSGASIFSSSSSQQQRFERNWVVDIDPNAKSPSPAQYIIYESGRKLIPTLEEPMNVRVRRITGQREGESSGSEGVKSQQKLGDKFGEDRNNVMSKQSGVEIVLPQPQSEFIKSGYYGKNGDNRIIGNLIETEKQRSNKFITITKRTGGQGENSGRHQTKHQETPSNVIQEMSDEYRGSNRQSIVHLDDNHYHYSASKEGSNGIVNITGSVGGQYAQSSGFSKLKNPMTLPAEQPSHKRTVHNEHLLPAQTHTNKVLNPVHRQTDLPIYSPTHSQIQPTQQPHFTDGLTGELVNGQDIKQRNDKRVYQTLTVNDYGDDGRGSLDKNRQQVKLIDGLTGEIVGGNRIYQNLNKKGWWENEPINSDKTYAAPYASNHSQGQQRPDIRLGHEYADQTKFVKQDNLSIKGHEPGVSNKTQQAPYIINGFTGELDTASQNRLSTKKSGINQTSFASTSSQKQNILRPSHCIETQVVKLPVSSSSINDFYSRNSIATQKKIINQDYNLVNGRSIQSTTSIKVPLNKDAYNYQGNKATYNVIHNNNMINRQNKNQTSGYQTTYGRYISPSNHTLPPTPNNYDRQSTPSYKVYTAEEYQSRNDSHRNQPEVINRVYIKASQLPDRTNDLRRYNETITVSREENVTREDYRGKLSVEDIDPFNEKTGERNSAMRKGSYMERKQTGKRDPYSPYQQNGASRIQREKSGVKIYMSDKYQRINGARRVASPNRQTITTITEGIDLNNYEKVIENGVTIYRQKSTSIPALSNTATYERVTNQKKIQPFHRQNHNYPTTNIVTTINSHHQGGLIRYEPSGRQYANSPTRRTGSSYQKSLSQQNPLRHPSTQHPQVMPLKPSHTRPLVYNPQSPLKVSQSNQQQAYTYQSPTRHVVETLHQPIVIDSRRVETNRMVPDDSIGTNRMAPYNSIGIISVIQHKNSQIFQPSEGSIMRRNNIRFGINKYRESQAKDDGYEYLEGMKSKIMSKIVTLSEINRNYLVEKKIINEQQIVSEKQAYSYINTAVNQFRFLVDEGLNYLEMWLGRYLRTKNDVIERFRGIEGMYEKLQSGGRPEDFDVTFVFVKKEDVKKVNKKLIPENCFVVEIMSEDYRGLQIAQQEKRIRLSKLPLLKLAEKIIIEASINHIVLYQKPRKGQVTNNFEKQVNHLLSLFPEEQFVNESYEEPLNLELIERLIDQDPKFIRLYIICDQKQMINVVKQLQKIDPFTSYFPKDICKIICVPTDNQILKYQRQIEQYPNVAWMTNTSKIHDYKSLIKYALRQDEQESNKMAEKTKQKIAHEQQQKQKIYFHSRHRNFPQAIQKQFPARFSFEMFNSLADVEKKIIKVRGDRLRDMKSTKKDRYKTVSTANNTLLAASTVNYLVLHPVLSQQYVDVKVWRKVFMLGRSDKMQRKVVKIESMEELVELLRE